MSKSIRAFNAVCAAVVGVFTVWATMTTAMAADKDGIKIGFALSQTGPASSNALELRRSYEMWQDKVKSEGGIFVKEYGKKLPVTFIEYDDKSDASTSARLYERLIAEDHADLLLSPWGSGINFAVSAVTEKHAMNLVMASASSDTIYARGYKYVFQATELASHDAVPLIDLLTSHKSDLKNIAILLENNLFAQTVYDAFTKQTEGKGLNVVMTEKFPPAGQSFATQLIKAKAMNADALLVFAMPPSTIYVTRQMYEVGMVPKFEYVLTGPTTPEFMQGLQKHAEGVVEQGFWHPALPYQGTKEFAAAFQKRYGHPPSTDAAHAWIETQVLEQAIAAAGTLDQKKLNEVLHSSEFNTVGGPYKYDEAGRNSREIQFLVQVQGGQRTIVWPPNLAQSPLRIPGPKS